MCTELQKKYDQKKCSKCAWEVETMTWNEVQMEVSVLLNISYQFMFSPFSAFLYHLHLHLFMLTCACHTLYINMDGKELLKISTAL